MSRMTHTYEPRISDNPSGTLSVHLHYKPPRYCGWGGIPGPAGPDSTFFAHLRFHLNDTKFMGGGWRKHGHDYQSYLSKKIREGMLIIDDPSYVIRTIAEDHGPGDTVELRLWHLEN